MGRLFEAPRPWHLILAPAIPLLSLLRQSLDISPPHVLIGPLVVAMLGAVGLWLMLLPFAADRLRAAFAVTLLMLVGMSYLAVERFARPMGIGMIVPVLYVAVAVVSGAIMRSRRPAASLTSFANVAALLTVVFLSLPIGWAEFRRTATTVERFPVASSTGMAERPDVYVLVLDAYAREDVLRDVYSFDNPLVGELRALRFFVADNATANYAHTSLSLASALNGDYLPALKHPEHSGMVTRRGLADLIRDSRFFSAFADAGYQVTSYSSEYAMVRPRQADHTPGPFGSLDEFGYATFESTALPVFFQWARLTRAWLPLKLHRRHVRWTFDHLATDVPDDQSRPALVFAHLLAPHPPFAFDAGGGDRSTDVPALFHDGSGWHAIAHETGESYKDGYLSNLRFVNAGILRALKDVVSRRHRPAIFLVHGDHGPGSGLNWYSTAETDIRERLGILLAMRFPDGEAPPLGSRTTLVNAYRAVLNRALATALPPLEDRAYFSTWDKPFSYVDVTDRFECDGGNRLRHHAPFTKRAGHSVPGADVVRF